MDIRDMVVEIVYENKDGEKIIENTSKKMTGKRIELNEVEKKLDISRITLLKICKKNHIVTTRMKRIGDNKTVRAIMSGALPKLKKLV